MTTISTWSSGVTVNTYPSTTTTMTYWQQTTVDGVSSKNARSRFKKMRLSLTLDPSANITHTRTVTAQGGPAYFWEYVNAKDMIATMADTFC